MNITLEYRNPTPSHCDVAVFVNGAYTGLLKLRQDELDLFQHVIQHGLDEKRGDRFLGRGDPGKSPWELHPEDVVLVKGIGGVR